MEMINNYLDLNSKYLKEAEGLMKKRDYAQASEKFWGAAAEIVKAVAAKRDMELRSHGELHGFVTRLRNELNDPELTRLFAAASTLRQNFYENWLTPEMVEDYADAVREFVKKLKRSVK